MNKAFQLFMDFSFPDFKTHHVYIAAEYIAC